MSFGSHSNLFSEGARVYSDPNVRPHYPPNIFKAIYNFCSSSREAALDVATGIVVLPFPLYLSYFILIFLIFLHVIFLRRSAVLRFLLSP